MTKLKMNCSIYRPRGFTGIRKQWILAQTLRPVQSVQEIVCCAPSRPKLLGQDHRQCTNYNIAAIYRLVGSTYQYFLVGLALVMQCGNIVSVPRPTLPVPGCLVSTPLYIRISKYSIGLQPYCQFSFISLTLVEHDKNNVGLLVLGYVVHVRMSTVECWELHIQRVQCTTYTVLLYIYKYEIIQGRARLYIYYANILIMLSIHVHGYHCQNGCPLLYRLLQ